MIILWQYLEEMNGAENILPGDLGQFHTALTKGL